MTSLVERPELIGFFSYSRDDDADAGEALTKLRTRIQSELRTQLGRSRDTLRLWQDAEAISPGTLWEGQIDAAIAQSVFFIPIVTPRVVASKYCGLEFDKFLERERQLGREDLVFPILFVDVADLDDERVWRASPILSAIGTRQYVDWREHRYDPDSIAVRKAVAQFCARIVQALRKHKFVEDAGPAPVDEGGARRAGTGAPSPRDATMSGGAEGPATAGRATIGHATIGHATIRRPNRLPAWATGFDEGWLPIDALAIYAVLSLTGFVYVCASIYWARSDLSVFEGAFYYPFAFAGISFGLAQGLVYVVLGHRRFGRLALMVLVLGLGWLLSGGGGAALASLLPDWHGVKDVIMLGGGGLLWGAIAVGATAIVDRAVLASPRRYYIVGAAVAAAVPLPFLGALLVSVGVLPALLLWQLPVALAVFHGRKAAIIAACAGPVTPR